MPAVGESTKLTEVASEHRPFMGGLLHLVQRGGDWADCGPAQSPLLAVPNVTAHPSTASVQTSYYSMQHCNYLCTVRVNAVVTGTNFGDLTFGARCGVPLPSDSMYQ